MNEQTLFLIEKSIIVLAIFGGVMLVVALTTLVERRVAGFMQDRYGPNRVGPFGILQPAADGLKNFLKEETMPAAAAQPYFWMGPIISLAPALVTFAVVPFAAPLPIGESYVVQMIVADVPIGILYILALSSLGVYGVVMGGWASNNRWTLLGGLRGTAQLISYEVALGLSLIGLIMVFPSLKFSAIVEFQGELLFGWLPSWGIFLQPLGFLIFLFAAMAESERVPFDLPEGESEIVGFYTEYGGMKWGMYMFTDFMKVLIISCLLTTLFFGGYQVPWMGADGFHFPWGGEWLLPHGIVVLFQVLMFNLKVFFFCWLQILVRWTYPRFRYDQLMDFGWKLLIPLSLLNIAATGILMSIL